MGKELYNTYPMAKAVFDEADKLLGFSFSKKLFETDSAEIMDTEIIQVAIDLIIERHRSKNRSKRRNDRSKNHTKGRMNQSMRCLNPLLVKGKIAMTIPNYRYAF